MNFVKSNKRKANNRKAKGSLQIMKRSFAKRKLKEQRSGKKQIVQVNKAALIPKEIHFGILCKVAHRLINDDNIITLDKLTNVTHDIINSHNKIIESYGVVKGAKRWKNISLQATLLLEDREPLEVVEFSIGKTDKWPKALSALRPLFHLTKDVNHPIESRMEVYRFIISLLKLNKVCNGLSQIDLTTISPGTFKIPIEIEREFVSFIKERLASTPEDINNNLKRLKVMNPLMGTANGPNKKPKVTSAAIEAQELLRSPLGKNFSKICDLTGNTEFMNYIKGYKPNKFDNSTKVTKKQKVSLRRLATIPDSGNKARTVAICDFWTQTLLSPLENDLNDNYLIKNFENSSAFKSHSGGFNKAFKEHGIGWKSVDATAWTDNFPSRLQYLVLKELYGAEYAHNWQQLVVQCAWEVPTNKKGKTQTVKYSKGQGMGTKGSFAIASLTDHYFIEYVLTKHYNEVYPYQKVGDDLLVYDPKNYIMEYYSKIGVPVNPHKSKDCVKDNMTIEFVSRLARNGFDVSPISSRLVSRVKSQPLIFPVLIGHLNERGALPSNSVIENMDIFVTPSEVNRLNKLVSTFIILYSKSPFGDSLDVEGLKTLTEGEFTKLVILLQLLLQKKKFLLCNKEPSLNLELGETLINSVGNRVDIFADDQDQNINWSCFSKQNSSINEIQLAKQVSEYLIDDEVTLYNDLNSENYINFVKLRLNIEDIESRIDFTTRLVDSIFETESKLLGLTTIENLGILNHLNSKPMVSFLKLLNKAMLTVETHIDDSAEEFAQQCEKALDIKPNLLSQRVIENAIAYSLQSEEESPVITGNSSHRVDDFLSNKKQK